MANNTTRKTNGLFDGEGWKCNCDPRQPAVHYQAKRETENKGRWFYRCKGNKGTEEDCKFFLWQEEAERRQSKVNEAERITPRKSTKRSFVDYSNTDGDSYFASDGEWTIIKTITKVNNRQLKKILETPRKERRTEIKASPSTGRVAEISPLADDIFDTPAKRRSTSNLFNYGFHVTKPSEPQSFLGSPSKPFTSSPITPSHHHTSTTLSSDAAAILRKNSHSLPQHVQDELLSHLDRHWKQAEDYRLDRDIAKQDCKIIAVELRTVTEKVAALLERVQQLEKEKAMQDETNIGTDKQA